VIVLLSTTVPLADAAPSLSRHRHGARSSGVPGSSCASRFGASETLLAEAQIPMTLPDGSPDSGLILADSASADEAITDFIAMVDKGGFAAKRGLKVELLQIKPGATLIKALSSGKIDSVDMGAAESIVAGVRGTGVTPSPTSSAVYSAFKVDYQIAYPLIFRRHVGNTYQMFTLPVGSHSEFRTKAPGTPESLYKAREPAEIQKAVEDLPPPADKK
jgi:hypothetical protein